jgi:serine protease SohB
LQSAGLGVTVCVDEVAASGGYLMACVADKVVASPFAILGSIGVVSSMPNFSDRMKREGVIVEGGPTARS